MNDNETLQGSSGAFAWHFDEDRTQVHIDLGTVSFRLMANEVAQLGIFLAILRMHMAPGAPATPEDANFEELLVADAYVVRMNPETGATHLWSRVPGIGWVNLALDAEQTRQLLFTTARPPVAEQPSAMVLH